ncbi:BLUF domain-containing protein [Microbacterium sp. SORGH_AS_0888]|uniref:BLUF domain-containing protein n=1 Tax=Microbacterium sp. SORGH_AS_0888 TaxID=3041791 RepID=UPI0027D8D6FB|nr:BLUF domain-containing protein [Microbacterium sp. SORGH_AS_0888]
MTAVHPDLISLMYASEAVEAFDDDELAALLAQSRSANQRNDITGMLLYRSGRFVQVLEGSAHDVHALVDRIRADPRHTRLRVMLEEGVPERRFEDWSMGYQSLDEPSDPAPSGVRDTFHDLEQRDDENLATRAAHELSLWFRVRAGDAS